jgi:hypothetical protein
VRFDGNPDYFSPEDLAEEYRRCLDECEKDYDRACELLAKDAEYNLELEETTVAIQNGRVKIAWDDLNRGRTLSFSIDDWLKLAELVGEMLKEQQP